MTQANNTTAVSEKRRHPRIDTSNKVRFILFDKRKEKIGYGKGIAINLSQSGALLQTAVKLEGAFIVLMAIDLDGNSIKINGKIISSRACGETNTYLTGIEFAGPKDKQLSAIIVFVKDFHRRKHRAEQQQKESN